MRKLVFIFACVGAVLTCDVNTSANAQEVAVSQILQSRIYPSEPDDGRARIPSLTVTRTQPAQRDENFEVATASDLIDSIRLCQATVSPRFEVRPRILVDDGWGYTQPIREQNELGNFISVRYYKNDLTIGLLDFGNAVACRIVARIANIEQLTELRAELASGLGAVPIRDVRGMDTYVNAVSGNLSDAELMNMMVAGDYSLEFATRAVDARDMGLSDGATVTLILLTSVPLPIQFQSIAQTPTP